MSVRLAKVGRLRWTLLCALLLSAIVAVAVPLVTAPVATPPGAKAPLPVSAASPPSLAPPATLPRATTPPASSSEARPLWAELTETQKKALLPLEGDWPTVDSIRKKKWLEIAARYPAMKPGEQQRLQERMRDWAKLSPEDRRVAREIYTRTKTLGADQKSAEWQEYQRLPEAEKQRLATDVAAKKRVANLPSGTVNVKPAAAAKATDVPAQPRAAIVKPASSVPLILPAVVAPPPPEVAPAVTAPVPTPAPVQQPIPMIN